jgi:hypothetical protein
MNSENSSPRDNCSYNISISMNGRQDLGQPFEDGKITLKEILEKSGVKIEIVDWIH